MHRSPYLSGDIAPTSSDMLRMLDEVRAAEAAR